MNPLPMTQEHSTMSFATALAAHDELDSSTLALMVGVDDDEVGRWIEADTVPPHHQDAVAAHLGIDAGVVANGHAPSPAASAAKRKKPRKRTSTSRRRGGMTKTAVEAATTCARLSVMDPAKQAVLTTVLDVDLDTEDRVEMLVALTEKVLSPPKTLGSAIEGVAKVREEGNATRAGMALATMDKAELKEIHRIVCACTGVPATDLPANNIDAAMAVLESVSGIAGQAEETFDWITELFG
ncbi:hypothetical protein DVS28_b0531 (plasmid) [Euzebya pacifica]|uniref:Uncharacterized protein n=1 Tax=Euzebya pacifica TaxID=1608957 RepID=A0A346Y724_9ACTN|nr:hypothetical protein [Euzebya pacifica]AXV10271.1 hypothetical protein DVS28_b0531 [Euzebya pacifica]